jgi:uncharacterized protein (DUF2235 family)
MDKVEGALPQPEADEATGAAAPPRHMAKSIVLFSDGTGNSSGKLFKTNVFRMYEAVDLGPTQANQQRQIAYYDNGVGTSAFKPLRMLQGILGVGLKRNVLEIYAYACRNYNPRSVPFAESNVVEPGDHIYGFGFSRGAFTMRLVIGLIADQGLIPYTNEQDLNWKVEEAWKRFRRRWPRSIERVVGFFRKRRYLREKRAEAEAALPERAEAASVKTETTPPPTDEYDPRFNYRPVIRFIGVWDTVAAYGGPIAEITRAIDNFIYRLSMPDYELHPQVRRARHALALDDERDSFHPLLWDELAEKTLRADYAGKIPWLTEDRLQQVWFVGMHADVGGGYPDESLSYVSLLWMLEEAHECGLRTVDLVTDRYHGLASSFGPVHNSRAGFAGYYRYQPRRIDAWTHPIDDRTLSLRDPAIRDPGGKKKGLIEMPNVHASVIARIASGTDGYAPIVLPAKFRIVPDGVMRETRFLETSGGFHRTPDQVAEARRNAPPLLAPEARQLLAPKATAKVADRMEQAWDVVWWRRVTYFGTMLATLLLFAMPWWLPPEISRIAGASVGFRDLPIIDSAGEAIGNLLRMVGEVLPGLVERWIGAWSENPFWFLFFVTSIVATMLISRRLERGISDIARRTWHSAIPRIPPATADDKPRWEKFRGQSWLTGSRNSYAYQRGLQLFKWLILPNAVFGPAMVALIFWFFHAVGVQLALPFVEATTFCQRSASQVPITEAQSDFTTGATCNPVNGGVTAGERYTISFEVTEPWTDGKYSATPAGIAAGDMRWGVGYLGAPTRRAIGSSYLQPVAAVRSPSKPNSFRFVQLRPLQMVASEENPNLFQAEFEAPTDGELFLFANDAVPLFDIDYFYGNNGGKARVTVTSAKHAAALAAAEAAAEPVGPPPPASSSPKGPAAATAGR